MMNLLILSLTLFSSAFSMPAEIEKRWYVNGCRPDGSFYVVDGTPRTHNCSTFICPPANWQDLERQCLQSGMCYTIISFSGSECKRYRCGSPYLSDLVYDGCYDTSSGDCVDVGTERTDSSCRKYRCTLLGLSIARIMRYVGIDSRCLGSG